MPDQEFESVEAIKKFYGKQIKDAEEADKPALQLAQAEAIAEFADRRAAVAERKVWLKEAMEKYPDAAEIPELVTGSTQEEIEASAKATAERVGKMKAAAGNPAADDFYGKEPIRPGNGSPPPPRQSDDEKFIADFQRRWNAKNANGGEGVSKSEIDRYVQLLAGTHVAAHLAENSRIPAVRTALASAKPK